MAVKARSLSTDEALEQTGRETTPGSLSSAAAGGVADPIRARGAQASSREFLRVASRAPHPTAQPKRKWLARRLLNPTVLFALATTALLIIGLTFPTERYITPKRGLGYALGIIGGSLMLILLLYSARKHFRWLSFLGPAAQWFRFHMVLGILGPLCILYHSNFGTGATNSNVALFSMLTVAGSGLIGRYIYARVHHGLYGGKLDLRELQASADGLRALSGTISFLPELVSRLEALEKKVLNSGPRLPLLGFIKPPIVAMITAVSRWRLHRYVRKALRQAARKSTAIAAERKRLLRTACAYVDKRLAATRRVAQLQGYERLFSLWHALHLPLIFMLIIAAVVHVIAVNIY
jgi:hypothetical protein